MTIPTSQNLSDLSPAQLLPYSYQQLAKMSGISRGTIKNRLYRLGWSLKKAVTTPVQKIPPKKKIIRDDPERNYQLDIQYSIKQGIKWSQLQPGFIPNTEPFEVWRL